MVFRYSKLRGYTNSVTTLTLILLFFFLSLVAKMYSLTDLSLDQRSSQREYYVYHNKQRNFSVQFLVEGYPRVSLVAQCLFCLFVFTTVSKFRDKQTLWVNQLCDHIDFIVLFFSLVASFNIYLLTDLPLFV